MDLSLTRLSGTLRVVVGEIATNIGFFSRLPLPARLVDPNPDLPRALGLLPLAALVIALPAVLVLILFGASHLPTLAVATLAVAVLAVTTGFLHEDGLSDAADGLIGGKSREDRLEIMRDSRIGAFGAAALALTLLLRVVLLAGLLDRYGLGGAAAGLLVTAAVSRAAMILFWVGLPPARSDGLAATIGQPVAAAVLLSLALAAVLSLLLGLTVTGVGLICAGLGFVGVVIIALSLYADSRVGGQTGDILGAQQQLAEIGFMMGLLM